MAILYIENYSLVREVALAVSFRAMQIQRIRGLYIKLSSLGYLVPWFCQNQLLSLKEMCTLLNIEIYGSPLLAKHNNIDFQRKVKNLQ